MASFWEIIAHFTRLTIFSLCILTIVILVISRFGFEGWIWIPIASVPDLCILFTFIIFTYMKACICNDFS